jgi:pyridoxal phosphate enzyme (YggS family)
MVQLARPCAATQEVSSPGTPLDLEARYERLMSERSVRSFLRQGGEVFLATERQPVESVRVLLGLGHRHFAEKYVQEATSKWPALRASTPGLRLSDFGRLQTNKVRAALALFDTIESVDRPSLALALARKRVDASGRASLYVQVNTGKEPQKGGLFPEDVARFCAYCRDELGLPIAGLMAIPPRSAEPRAHFSLLRRLADDNQLAGCSMGMSGDYPVAIDCGATVIRIGRAVFGAAKE